MKRSKTGSPAPRTAAARDDEIVRLVCRWFGAAARPLPWRTAPRDPYRSLVSEVMAQQTQISRVAERFGPFVARFPDVGALAAAPEADVLALWSGLGYYRRARNLHAAAKKIVAEFGGAVPTEAGRLGTLPGIGRYTAGAISSIVFNRAEPIVDGNVARVLLRVEGRAMVHGSGPAQAWAWERAGDLVAAAADARGASPARFNEGLMELGATVCTPGRPDCSGCPLAGLCIARTKGLQERIPRPKPPPARRVIYCAAAVLTDAKGRVLLERRDGSGMWAGLWQAPTLEAGRPPGARGIEAGLGLQGLERIGRFTHQTSHREVRFVVFGGRIPARHAARRGRTLVAPEALGSLGLGSAQRRVIALGLGT